MTDIILRFIKDDTAATTSGYILSQPALRKVDISPR